MIYILLPCYNEYQNLIILIDKINYLLIKNNFKIKLIIVNDGSTDDIDKKINKLKQKSKTKIIYIKHKKNLGLNMSLFTGFKKFLTIAKSNDIVVTLDSDNTHPISLIPKIVIPIKKKSHDIVIASRFQKGSKVEGLNLFRIILSEGARVIYKLAFSISNVRDYTCNFRGYNYNVLKKSNLINKKFFQGKDFSVVADLLINLNSRINDVRIKEVPLKLRYDFKIGESKLKIFKNIFKSILVILRNIIN